MMNTRSRNNSRTPRNQPIGAPARRTPTLFAPALLALAAAHAAAAAADTVSEAVRFNIQAQSLETALAAYGDQARVQIVVPSQLVQGMQTHGLSGDYKPKDALNQLLNSSGLTYQMSSGNTVTVLRMAQAAPAGPAAPTAAAAEAVEVGGLSEIVVTAQKRAERMQDVPIAITAISGEDLEKRAVTDFSGVASNTPSLTIAHAFASANTLIVYMRGQGANNPLLNTEGGVGMYVDGFYIARSNATTFDMADIERVEVLRGPQGTLYGRNTTGGAVNIISKAPSGEFGVKQSLTFGNRNLFRSLTTLDLPSWEGLSAKVSVLKSSIDGYVHNANPASHDFGEQGQKAARLQLRLDRGNGFTADYYGEIGEIRDTGYYVQNATLNGLTINGYPYHTNPSGADFMSFMPLDVPLNTSKYYSHGVVLSWQISDALKIKSLTGYRDLQIDSQAHFPGVFTYGVSPSAPFYPLDIATKDTMRDHQFSQELQFVGSHFENQLNYVAGLYYFNEAGTDKTDQNTITFGDDQFKALRQDSTSKAVFGQLTYAPAQLDRKLELTLGLRYNVDDRSLARYSTVNGVVIENYGEILPTSPTGADASKRFSKFNPGFTINYHWTSDLSTYAKVATAYRAGGFTAIAPVGRFNEAYYGPENVTSYELGLKSEWFQRRLRFNADVFSSQLKDMQVGYNVDAAHPSDAIILNAGKARINGAEVELRVLATDSLQLGLDYTALDAKVTEIAVLPGSVFDRAVNPASPYAAGENMAALWGIPRTPKHSFAVTADNEFGTFGSAELSAHADYRWQSAYSSNQNITPAFPGYDLNVTPSYGLLNLSMTASWKLDHVRTSVTLWGNNVLDKAYLLNNAVSQYGVLPANGGAYSQAWIWAPGASYGLSLIAQF